MKHHRNFWFGLLLSVILLGTMGATQDSCTEPSFTKQVAADTQQEEAIDSRTIDGFVVQSFVDRNYIAYHDNGESGTVGWNRYIHLVVKSAQNNSVYVDKSISVKDDKTDFSYETENYLFTVCLNKHGGIISLQVKNKY